MELKDYGLQACSLVERNKAYFLAEGRIECMRVYQLALRLNSLLLVQTHPKPYTRLRKL